MRNETVTLRNEMHHIFLQAYLVSMSCNRIYSSTIFLQPILSSFEICLRSQFLQSLIPICSCTNIYEFIFVGFWRCPTERPQSCLRGLVTWPLNHINPKVTFHWLGSRSRAVKWRGKGVMEAVNDEYFMVHTSVFLWPHWLILTNGWES